MVENLSPRLGDDFFRSVFMNKVIIEMPPVSRCDVSNCAYNVNKNCHAKAVTVGDFTNPGCDTFLDSVSHNKDTRRIAGVGACKVSECRFNDYLECVADEIVVGFANKKVSCLTYAPR